MVCDSYDGPARGEGVGGAAGGHRRTPGAGSGRAVVAHPGAPAPSRRLSRCAFFTRRRCPLPAVCRATRLWMTKPDEDDDPLSGGPGAGRGQPHGGLARSRMDSSLS